MNWLKKMQSDLSSGNKIFVLHGNIHDIFPYNGMNGTLRRCLETLLFNDSFYCYFDCSGGLKIQDQTFNKEFNDYLKTYSMVENASFDLRSKDLLCVLNVLKRFSKAKNKKVNIYINAAEAFFPSDERIPLGQSERETLVGFLYDFAIDFGPNQLQIFLVSESINDLNRNIINSDYVYKCQVELPNEEDRKTFLEIILKDFKLKTDLTIDNLVKCTSGLNLIKMYRMITRAASNQETVTFETVALEKKKVIEDFCQGLVRFKEPKPEMNLDMVATHVMAKKKLRELVSLFKSGNENVIEKGILIPGRVGVGKSFIVECFAAECGMPVLELAEFRSKWVGDTEKQLQRILLTVKALGPVIVVVDEADAVFGNRSGSGDSGVSNRVFATLAAHIGDPSIRGREIWIAMTSRPELLPIDMKRQGRFGLSIPLFPALNVEEVKDLFKATFKIRKVKEASKINLDLLRLVNTDMTGSEIESIVVRAQENAVLEKRAEITVEDLQVSIDSFLNPLDPVEIEKQIKNAVLSCTDKRFVPEPFLKYLG